MFTRMRPLHGPFWSHGDVVPEQIYAVSMLPGPFWSLGDVIPEQIVVQRFAGETHNTMANHYKHEDAKGSQEQRASKPS